MERKTRRVENQPCESFLSLQAHMCRNGTAAGSTCCPIKHPNGNFQKTVRSEPGEIAPKHGIAGFVDRRMDIDQPAEPGMPWIKNLAPVGNVGVLASSCTPKKDRTAPLGTTVQQRS
jgi:hypothetical protein